MTLTGIIGRQTVPGFCLFSLHHLGESVSCVLARLLKPYRCLATPERTVERCASWSAQMRPNVSPQYAEQARLWRKPTFLGLDFKNFCFLPRGEVFEVGAILCCRDRKRERERRVNPDSLMGLLEHVKPPQTRQISLGSATRESNSASLTMKCLSNMFPPLLQNFKKHGTKTHEASV